MRAFLKLLFFLFASFLMFPFIIAARLMRDRQAGDAVFQGISQLLSIIPFRLGVYLRAAFYSNVCPNIDREVAIGFMTLFSHTDTDLGRNVYIGAQSNIGSCSLGKDCLLGSGVHILSGKRQHDFSASDVPIRNQGGQFEKITIGENCWIGNSAIVMANVGEHSIVAAGSVVTNPVPPRSVVAGNPAKVLRTR